VIAAAADPALAKSAAAEAPARSVVPNLIKTLFLLSRQRSIPDAVRPPTCTLSPDSGLMQIKLCCNQPTRAPSGLDKLQENN